MAVFCSLLCVRLNGDVLIVRSSCPVCFNIVPKKKTPTGFYIVYISDFPLRISYLSLIIFNNF